MTWSEEIDESNMLDVDNDEPEMVHESLDEMREQVSRVADAVNDGGRPEIEAAVTRLAFQARHLTAENATREDEVNESEYVDVLNVEPVDAMQALMVVTDLIERLDQAVQSGGTAKTGQLVTRLQRRVRHLTY